MKKRIICITVFLLAILLAGCSVGPRVVVQNFFQAVDNGNIDEAMGYLSTSTIQSLGYGKWQAALIEGSQQMAAQGGLRSINIVNETINGDIAQITFRITMGDGSEETNNVDLVKEDGNWKIRIDPWSK